MDFSESSVWSTFTQFGILCLILLAANTLRTHVPILRKSLLPTAVIGGLIGFALRSLGLGSLFDTRFLNMIIYHFMAIGFIALSLKTSYGKGEIKRQASKDAFNSGLLIVGSYLLQALIGFSITILLALTIMPDLFKASGLLLPLGFGQGPGQANNWGYIYENTRYNTTESFTGGQTFGITIASIGFLCACIPGVVYMTWLNSKNKFITAKGFKNESVSDELGSEDEIPLAESIDKFTIQICFVMLTFLVSYGFMKFVDVLFIESGRLGEFGIKTVRPLIWGFNFIFGTLFAILVKQVVKVLRKTHLMNKVYLSNFMLNRITGFAFDFMIIASITLIDIKVLSNLWIPLLIICTAGLAGTFWYVKAACNTIYKSYPLEGFLSMYGMLTGTASTGVALLREADPDFDTPASQNLVSGSSTAIVFGFPMLLLLGIAPEQPYLVLILLVFFALVINVLLFRSRIIGKRKKNL